MLFLCRCEIKVTAGDVVLTALLPVGGGVDEKTKIQKPTDVFITNFQATMKGYYRG